MLAPIPTVFDGRGEPDLAMMERLTDWYLKAGVHGFFVLGSQGRGLLVMFVNEGGQYAQKITLEDSCSIFDCLRNLDGGKRA
jgi:hypothetical protein